LPPPLEGGEKGGATAMKWEEPPYFSVQSGHFWPGFSTIQEYIVGWGLIGNVLDERFHWSYERINFRYVRHVYTYIHYGYVFTIVKAAAVRRYGGSAGLGRRMNFFGLVGLCDVRHSCLPLDRLRWVRRSGDGAQVTNHSLRFGIPVHW